jgi:hypothetical protein
MTLRSAIERTPLTVLALASLVEVTVGLDVALVLATLAVVLLATTV